jgi:hypothetical protein
MVPGMKDSGKIIEHMAKASSLISMETFMMVNGSMIKLTGMEYIIILMELCMKASGETISNTEKERSPGPINLFTRVSTWLARSMEQASIAGTMDRSTMENGTKIKLKDSALTVG